MTLHRLVPVAWMFMMACAARHNADSGTPRLEAIQPDSVMIADGVVVEVTLRGSGFAPGTPGRNTVVFGRMTVNSVPANDDGTQIRFVIPDRMPSGGEAAPLPIDAGSYTILVRTPSGESNVKNVKVSR